MTSYICLILLSTATLHGEPWKRHVIDDSLRGADGTHLTCEERTNLGVIWFENPTR